MATAFLTQMSMNVAQPAKYLTNFSLEFVDHYSYNQILIILISFVFIVMLWHVSTYIFFFLL